MISPNQNYINQGYTSNIIAIRGELKLLMNYWQVSKVKLTMTC